MEKKISPLFDVKEKKLVNFTTERTTSLLKYVWGKFKKQDSGNFHEGFNSDCHTLLIYDRTILIEEQIKENHEFFIRRYNIGADPVV